MDIQKVGVLGTGNIGTGVITDLVLHGLNVVAVDLSESILERARADVLHQVRTAPMLSKNLARLSKEEALNRIRFTTDPVQVATCDFIIENVTEDWTLKKQVYQQLEQFAPPDICFGVNTSCISITKIAGVTQRPDKVVGLHLMNPVHLISTVEVIRGFHTSQETIDTLLQLFALLGKEAIQVEDFPGFVSNRISHIFMNEAAFVMQDNVASADRVDMIFKKCFGHKMGPLETADLIGLDTVMRSLDVLYESYQDPKYRCCPLLRKLVHAGQLGRKTGRGFHVYPSD